MFLTDTPRFAPILPAGKKFPAKNLDVISRSFDESLLRRLKPLIHHPSIDLSWLSLAVDLLSSTHAEAETLISDLKSTSGAENLLKKYLDESVKVLDICNSITSEIERLQKSRLLMNFVLHLLDFADEVPSLEKLCRAKNTLSERGNSETKTTKRNLNLKNPAILIKELAGGLGNPPRGKISTVGKLVERTVYAVGTVTVFVTGVVVAVLTGSMETIPIRVTKEFLWADAFNGLESAIYEEIKKKQKLHGRLIGELDEVDARVEIICQVIDDVDRKKDVVGESDRLRLVNAVKELRTVNETFSDGLDRLLNGVNGFFHTVLCTRNSLLQNFRAVDSKNRSSK